MVKLFMEDDTSPAGSCSQIVIKMNVHSVRMVQRLNLILLKAGAFFGG